MIFLAGIVVGVVLTMTIVVLLALCGLAKDIDIEE